MSLKLEFSFDAYDEDGNSYRLNVWRKHIMTDHMGGKGKPLRGRLVKVTTTDNRSVTILGPGSYELDISGEKLTSDDPQANQLSGE